MPYSISVAVIKEWLAQTILLDKQINERTKKQQRDDAQAPCQQTSSKPMALQNMNFRVRVGFYRMKTKA